MANLPHIHTPPSTTAGIIILNDIFDESWTCWSRNPCSRITRPERHHCSVWQASCVIYDLVMRQRGGQLDKGYSSKMRLSWLLLPWEDEGLDVASGDFDRHVNGIHKRGVFSVHSVRSRFWCMWSHYRSLFKNDNWSVFSFNIYKKTNENQIAKLIKKSR